MKLIFAGTPQFAAQALTAIVAAGHEVVLVLTQPDRPAGRGMQLQASAVKQAALALNLPVFQPLNFKEEADRSRLAEVVAAGAEVMVVAAYGLILPQSVLDIPPLGCLNIHASLLPRWRGAAPIQRAIAAGDAQTGVGIMQMALGLDTGDILFEEKIAIAPSDTAATLHDKLAQLGADAIVTALADLPALQVAARVQDEAGVVYAHKILKAEAAIDWQRPAIELDRQIRAFNPFPGMTFSAGGQTVKVWGAELIEGLPAAIPGTVLEVAKAGIDIACGSGALRLTLLQKPGGKRVAATLAGLSLDVGIVLA